MPPLLADPLLLGGAVIAFVLGGLVKGTLGVGLPLVVVPLLTLALPAPTAIALVVVPVLASNLWQAWDTGVSWRGVRRFAPLIGALFACTLLTVPMTLALPARALNAMVAGAVVLAVVLTMWRPKLDIRRETPWSLAVGALSGVMGGVSSLTGPIIISYLMALKLPRDEFVGSISIIYLGAALPLYASMAAHGRIGPGELALSALAMLPVSVGLWLGKLARGRLSEDWFRRVLLLFLCGVAAALFLK